MTHSVGADKDEAAGQGVWQDVLAQPALSGLSAPLMAALLDWLQATSNTLSALSQDQTPTQWGHTLNQLVQRFFAPAEDSDERAIARMLEPLQSWLTACESAQLDSALPLEVVREHWLSQIEVGGLQQRFFGGGVQFGTLMPMRSIPFAVIGLLGMNDGAYPRVQAARDFDLMATSWRVGDRSRREDDRYLFLEAILSARQKLYVSWQGHSASDNSACPPSVLVAQLLDHINVMWSPPHTPRVQPLQPFSRVYFEAGSGFETYDSDWAAAQVDKAQIAIDIDVTLAGLVCPASLTLDDLQRLLRAPVEVFFRNRLQTTLDQLDQLAEPDEPFALNALQKHQAGTDLLCNMDIAQGLARLQGSGGLPLAAFGQRTAQGLLDVAAQVRARLDPWQALYPQALDAQPVDLAFDGGFSVSGVLAGLFTQAGTKPVSLNNPDAKRAPLVACLQLAARPGAVYQGKKGSEQVRGHVLVTLWVRHLAGCASGLVLTSVMVGVDGQVVLSPMAKDAAQAALARLVQAYAQAWGAPLPVACKTAFAYLQTHAANTRLPPDKSPKDPHEAARTAFEGHQLGGEWDQSAYLQRAFVSYDEVMTELPHWAKELYGDLMAHLYTELITVQALP